MPSVVHFPWIWFTKRIFNKLSSGRCCCLWFWCRTGWLFAVVLLNQQAAPCVSCGLRVWPRVPAPCRRSFSRTWIFHLWMSWDQCPVFASPDRDHWSAFLFTATHLFVFLSVFRGHIKPCISSSLLFPTRTMHCTFSEVYLWKVLLINERIFF